MSEIRFNFFNSKSDNRVQDADITWEELVGLLSTGHQPLPDKFSAPAFNAVRYIDLNTALHQKSGFNTDHDSGRPFVQRLRENILEVNALVLDYDDTLSIAEAMQRFKDYEYVGYTSWGHMETKGVEKFRLVIRLTKPIPARIGKRNDWQEITAAIRHFAGPCDPKCLNPNQIYFIPTTHSSRIRHASVWHNKGGALDWEAFEKSQSVADTASGEVGLSGVVKGKQSGRYLLPDTLLHTAKGEIRVGDVKGKIQRVFCPFHDDKNGTEFVKRVSESGNIFLYCRRCDESFYMRQDQEDGGKLNTTATGKVLDPEIASTRIPTLEEWFEGVVDDKYQNADVDRAKKQLEQIKRNILTDDAARQKSHIVYMPEGAGKSRLALQFVLEGHKVVFACKSWEQVFEKHAAFNKEILPHGMRAEIAFSREGRIKKRFKVDVIRDLSRDSFTPGDIQKEETLKLIEHAHPKLNPAFIRLCWEFFSMDEERFRQIADEADRIEKSALGRITAIEKTRITQERALNDFFSGDTNPVYPDHIDNEESGEDEMFLHSRMVLTTFAQLRLIASKHDRIPRDWIVWFDDPGAEDVIDISPFKARRGSDPTLEEAVKGTRIVDNVRYDLRRPEQSLGYAVRQHRCVYTTTEALTKRLLCKMFVTRGQPYEVHDRMEAIVQGNVTLLGTENVQRRYDAMIPLVVRRLEKKGNKVILIADGLASKYNHTNSKGQNALNRTNIVIEISVPHPARIRTLCDALGVSFKENGDSISKELMLDQLHQAIGRNSGYRWQGLECVALVDKNRHAHLAKECRYLINKNNSVIIDRIKTMGRSDQRIPDDKSELVREMESLLTHIDDYVCDDRVIRHDVSHVVKTIEKEEERFSYLARLLLALTSHSNVRFDEKPSKEESSNRVVSKYRTLGEWVLETHAPKLNAKEVMTRYQRLLKEIDDSRTEAAKRKKARN